MSRNKIVIAGQEFLDHQINSGSVFISNSIAGDELSIDTLDAEMDCSGWARTLFRPKNSAGLITADDLLFSVNPRFQILASDLSKFSYGEKVYYYHDNALIGKFYLSAVKRVGKFFYELSCVSAVGLLDAAPHYGGLYNGQTLPVVLSDIIGGTVPYTVENAVKSIRVYGWLPVSTRRDNLRQLLFASGCALKKDVAGELSVCQLKLDKPALISDDRLMMGGSVDYQAAATEAVVVEHGYFQASNAADETLYNDGVQGMALTSPKGAALTGSLLTFDGPVYDLRSEGGGILESGVNYAVLAPSGLTKLTGKKYAHTTREVYAQASGANKGERNTARVEDATLVNAANSDAVAARVASYYATSRTVNMDMVMGVERPGDAVQFTDPFGDTTTALVLSQDINMSGTLVAAASFLAGYVPEGGGGAYSNSQLLSGSGTYTPPAGVTRIRVVLIGGGHGGTRGKNGQSGSIGAEQNETLVAPADQKGQARGYRNGRPGAGGGPGEPGVGGKIFQVTINLSGGERYAYSCGAGGASEQEGGSTSFGSYSSSAGSMSTTGYLNILTGERYAGQGNRGLAGGTGSGWVGSGAQTETKVTEGNVVTDALGRSWGPGASVLRWTTSDKTGYKGGEFFASVHTGSGYAGGGGAAYGANGGGGTNGSGTISFDTSTRTAFATVSGGSGGHGANALPPSKESRFGYGGGAGNGGGGGGGGPSNGANIYTSISNAGRASFDISPSANGAGGSGSAGGTGGDGCIIIYW